MDSHSHYQVDLSCTMWDEWWSSTQGLVSIYPKNMNVMDCICLTT